MIGNPVSGLALAMSCFLAASPTWAARLEVAPEAPNWMHLGAATLLFLHVGGGTLGLVAGTAASFTRKGGRRHRFWGRLFVAGMSVTYLVGAAVAPFLDQGQRPNFVAGVLALYLLVTGVAAAKRRRFRAGRSEVTGFALALAITFLGVAFMVEGAQDPSGTVDGSPPQAFLIFVVAGAAAAIGDWRALRLKTLSNAQRTTRHLWRMCASFFFASGSLFFGQPQIFPSWFVGSLLQAILAFGPLVIMAGLLVREARRGAKNSPAAAKVLADSA